MDFYAVLDRVIDLLRSRGRVTYGALKLQFGLDDEQLEVLKDEIISAQRLATDEDGRVLVWTGDVAGTQEGASPPAQSTPQAPLQQHLPSQSASLLPTTPHTPEAERRQLTVMFCDLVESTKLASQLDPEEYRDVVRAYQRVCSEVITRFDGHIAQLLGDGLLVYFGYPQAHEDDPQRAVRAGLGMLAAMGDLNSRLQQDKGIQLAIRIGIHTGLVVIGEMGGAGRQEQFALGETPNLAARMQGLAQPNTLAVSEATYRLVEGYFTCESLGEHTLRGVSQPLNMYRVLGASGVYSRLDVAQTRGLTPLVGRESEVTLLLERWAQVKDGQGHVVLLTGDAGIGKSRLVQVLKEHVANEPHMRWECRSSEYSQNTALFPLTDLFQRLLQFEAHEEPLTRNWRNSNSTEPVSTSLGGICTAVRTFTLTAYPRRPVILRSIYHHNANDRKRSKPSSASSWNWLNVNLYSLFWKTCTGLTPRPWSCWTPARPNTHGFPLGAPDLSSAFPTCMASPFVSHRNDGQSLIPAPGGTDCDTHYRWKTLPHEVMQQIIAKTDGVPLFVEEITKSFWNQDSSQPSMGTTNSQGRSPRSPFQPRSRIR